MSSNIDEMQEITPLQRRAGNILAGVFVLACGIFLLLCGLKVIPLPVSKIIVGSLLCTVGLVLLSTGIVQKNPVSLWLSFVFLLPALVELLTKATPLTYSQLYPIYISIPAYASFFTMLMSHEWYDHFKVILLFGALSVIFGLQAGGIGWSIVLPVLVIFIGALIIYFAIKKSKGDKNEQL